MYAYERGGRIKSVLYPDGSGESYAYDAAGNMTDRTTNAGEHWHYSHDALDRIIAITNPAGGGGEVYLRCIRTCHEGRR